MNRVIRGEESGKECRRLLGRTTSVLFFIVDVNPEFGCNVRLVGSKEFFQMPASPVCRDTLVSATVGAALILLEANSTKDSLSAARNVESVVVTKLTFPVCVDIKLPLLLLCNSNKILMRELFPQAKKKATPLCEIDPKCCKLGIFPSS